MKKILGVILCLVVCGRPAAAQFTAEVHARTDSSAVDISGLAVASSDYQHSVNGVTLQAHVQTITAPVCYPEPPYGLP